MAIESAAKLVALQSHHAQDVLVGQAKTFIEATLVTYVLLFSAWEPPAHQSHVLAIPLMDCSLIFSR